MLLARSSLAPSLDGGVDAAQGCRQGVQLADTVGAPGLDGGVQVGKKKGAVNSLSFSLRDDEFHARERAFASKECRLNDRQKKLRTKFNLVTPLTGLSTPKHSLLRWKIKSRGCRIPVDYCALSCYPFLKFRMEGRPVVKERLLNVMKECLHSIHIHLGPVVQS